MTGSTTSAGESTAGALRRLIGGTTALCIGLGVAIGSGVFRTPGIIASELGSARWIVVAWICGGAITLAASLVTAELATRFSRAGGEYVFLRAAYGDFVSFFFGWAYTVFIAGGGVAVIAAASGEAACELFAAPDRWAPWIGAAIVAGVVAVHCAGLRTGAATQNVLTLAKVAALLGIGVLAIVRFGVGVKVNPAADAATLTPGGSMFIAALLNVMWAYDGSTDSAKMAEEITDVRRALPRALVASCLLLTFVYVLVNWSFLVMMTPAEMGQSRFVASDAMARIAGEWGRALLSGMTLLICVGCIASTTLASVRVPFALARDGFAPAALARVSDGQAPIPALLLMGAITIAFTLVRDFRAVLSIYMFAAAILFSMTYASLIVFRRRFGAPPSAAFRCPAGPLLAAGLIAFEAWLAAHVARTSPRDTLYSLVLLAVIAAGYALWRRIGTVRRAPPN